MLAVRRMQLSLAARANLWTPLLGNVGTNCNGNISRNLGHVIVFSIRQARMLMMISVQNMARMGHELDTGESERDTRFI